MWPNIIFAILDLRLNDPTLLGLTVISFFKVRSLPFDALLGPYRYTHRGIMCWRILSCTLMFVVISFVP
jgi:hypothetical protein